MIALDIFNYCFDVFVGNYIIAWVNSILHCIFLNGMIHVSCLLIQLNNASDIHAGWTEKWNWYWACECCVSARCVAGVVAWVGVINAILLVATSGLVAGL